MIDLIAMNNKEFILNAEHIENQDISISINNGVSAVVDEPFNHSSQKLKSDL